MISRPRRVACKKEDDMAKGQLRPSKEKRKPKAADKAKAGTGKAAPPPIATPVKSGGKKG
jgi:hypothetical protein